MNSGRSWTEHQDPLGWKSTRRSCQCLLVMVRGVDGRAVEGAGMRGVERDNAGASTRN